MRDIIKRKKMSPMRKNEIMCGFIFIAPLVLGLGIFYLFAFFQNVYYSFTNLSSFQKPDFIGLDNYIKLFSDEKFYIALKNTFMYVVLGVPAVVIFATFAAVLLNAGIKGRTFLP